MKKLVILLSMVMLFVTGCSVTKLDNTDIGKNMKTLLSQNNKMYNVYYSGYRYYLPKGISFVNNKIFLFIYFIVHYFFPHST